MHAPGVKNPPTFIIFDQRTFFAPLKEYPDNFRRECRLHRKSPTENNKNSCWGSMGPSLCSWVRLPPEPVFWCDSATTRCRFTCTFKSKMILYILRPYLRPIDCIKA